jgi:protein-arginine kinase activator protein McsA
MLCDKCQIREATVHFTTCSSPAVEKPKHDDLCQECFEASDLAAASGVPTDFQAVVQSGCRYCGGEFHSGGFDLLALLGGVRRMSVMCKPCAEEYFGFLRLKLPGLGDHCTKEQTALLVASAKAGDFPAILAELEEHMKGSPLFSVESSTPRDRLDEMPSSCRDLV